MRDAYRSAVVGEAARLALKAGARYVVIHTVLDDPSAAEMYARIGFRPVASVARVVFSPAGTVALR
jgi:predicted GNAT family acetyltransferase